MRADAQSEQNNMHIQPDLRSALWSADGEAAWQCLCVTNERWSRTDKAGSGRLNPQTVPRGLDTAQQTEQTQPDRQAAGVAVRKARRESSHFIPSWFMGGGAGTLPEN